jgi:hypothetical protein
MNSYNITPSTNIYKMYYYLIRLYNNKVHLYPHIKNNINIVQNKVENNNILNEYGKLLPLLNPNIKFEKFKKIIKDNLYLLRSFGYQKTCILYLHVNSKYIKSEGSDEENMNIIIKNITDEDINNVYNYINYTHIQQTNYIKKNSVCKIIPQYKSGAISEPANFRYFSNHDNVIKIIDRLWCIKVLHLCGDNLPDTNIFKSGLIIPDFSEIAKLSNNKTQELENKVIIDIKKAFDSMDWAITYKLLLENLTRKINKSDSKTLVDQYFTIIKHRNIYYKNKLIDVNIGIPLGLPSSQIVFQFVIEEILLRWLYDKDFKKYFELTIYMDDILFEFNSCNKINFILYDFINYIKLYGFNISKKKLKISSNIYNGFLGSKLTNSDFYLGVPFTRDIQLYGSLILKSFQDKYMHKMSWYDIYNYIIKNNINKNCILGFITFKLKPLIKYNSNKSNEIIKINQDVIVNFIKEHYLTESKINNIFDKCIKNIICNK